MLPPQSWIERNRRTARAWNWLVRHEYWERRNEPLPSAYIEEVRIKVRRRVLVRPLRRRRRRTAARPYHERMPVVRRNRNASAWAHIGRNLVRKRRKTRSRRNWRMRMMLMTVATHSGPLFFLVADSLGLRSTRHGNNAVMHFVYVGVTAHFVIHLVHALEVFPIPVTDVTRIGID